VLIIIQINGPQLFGGTTTKPKKISVVENTPSVQHIISARVGFGTNVSISTWSKFYGRWRTFSPG
jgi:hypothetical protein